jgi:hypothetical protein
VQQGVLTIQINCTFPVNCRAGVCNGRGIRNAMTAGPDRLDAVFQSALF